MCVCVCVHPRCAACVYVCAAGCAYTCVCRQAVPLGNMFVYQHPMALGEWVPLRPQLPHTPEELRQQGRSPHTAAEPAEPESTQCPWCVWPLVPPGCVVSIGTCNALHAVPRMCSVCWDMQCIACSVPGMCSAPRTCSAPGCAVPPGCGSCGSRCRCDLQAQAPVMSFTPDRWRQGGRAAAPPRRPLPRSRDPPGTRDPRPGSCWDRPAGLPHGRTSRAGPAACRAAVVIAAGSPGPSRSGPCCSPVAATAAGGAGPVRRPGPSPPRAVSSHPAHGQPVGLQPAPLLRARYERPDGPV